MIKTIRTSPTNIDAEGFRARLAGFEVRDCFLILEPDRNVSLALLAREEGKESILDRVVRTGEGVLDIDGGRVVTTDTYSYPNGAGGNSFSVRGGRRITNRHTVYAWGGEVSCEPDTETRFGM
jgi:hypothetical protein